MLPCLNLALSDVMANISQLEWQTGIKEIAIVHMAIPPAGGGGPGHWEEAVELQQPAQGQLMNYYQWYLSWFCDIK